MEWAVQKACHALELISLSPPSICLPHSETCAGYVAHVFLKPLTFDGHYFVG